PSDLARRHPASRSGTGRGTTRASPRPSLLLLTRLGLGGALEALGERLSAPTPVGGLDLVDDHLGALGLGAVGHQDLCDALDDRLADLLRALEYLDPDDGHAHSPPGRGLASRPYLREDPHEVAAGDALDVGLGVAALAEQPVDVEDLRVPVEALHEPLRSAPVRVDVLVHLRHHGLVVRAVLVV